MAENYFGITDTGRVRDNNEDTFIAEKVLNNRFIAACVIDGVGGYEGGEVAAAIAKESILTELANNNGDLKAAMRQAFINANINIYNEKAKGKNSSMACVATLALVNTEDNFFYYAHVGDTRLYLLRDNSLIKVSKDHSFVGFLEDSGRLNEKDAMTHPKRNEVNKALGFDPQIDLQKDYIEIGESPFLPGDTILLCSDGLTDMVKSAEMTSIITSKNTLQQKGKALIEAANREGGKDNITVVLVQNDTKPIKLKATKPIALVKKKDVQEVASDQTESARNKLPNVVIKKKSNWLAITILSLLCIALAGALIWLWLKQNKTADPAVEKTAVINNSVQKNANEQKLAEAINALQADTLFLDEATYGQSIALTDTLWIRKDSFAIKAIGNLSIIKDSVQNNNPVIAIDQSCRYVLFDSITFKNIDFHILAPNKNPIRFKNVRLMNSNVNTAYNFADSVYITGKLWDTALLKRSLPQ